jgi:hypothetical protein
LGGVVDADTALWEPLDDRVRRLRAPVGELAFSPDETHLAWSDGSAPGLVRVTELSSSRTVVSFTGAPVSALHWASPETLRVVRHTAPDATLTLHAVPDGGTLATFALPGVGPWPPALDASADGSLAVLGRATMLTAAPSALWFVGGAHADEVMRVDPFERVTMALRERWRTARWALNPDGTSLAFALGSARSAGDAGPSAAPHVVVTDLDARTTTVHAITDEGDPTLLRWTSPTRLIAALLDASGATLVHAIETHGPQSRVARLSPSHLLRGDAAVDVHPDRDRLLLGVLCRSNGLTRPREAVVTVSLAPTDTPATPRIVTLTRDDLTPSTLAGAACWSASGDTLAIAHPESDAVPRRADEAVSSAREIARVALTGARPQRFALRPSARHAFTAATWFSFERVPRGTAGGAQACQRRLVLIAR